MGYTTDFKGQLAISPPLTKEQTDYIKKFSTTRRMKRDATIAEGLADPVRLAVGLPIGAEGGYYVGAGGWAGQDTDSSVTNHNSPPSGQPGLWCQWTSNSGHCLEWDENEKFYHYIEWLAYLIEHIFVPWGRTLDGTIHWQGEDRRDIGTIVVKDNVIAVNEGE
jgi:hypothetical protein